MGHFEGALWVVVVCQNHLKRFGMDMFVSETSANAKMIFVFFVILKVGEGQVRDRSGKGGRPGKGLGKGDDTGIPQGGTQE